jgi:hypothetical protein
LPELIELLNDEEAYIRIEALEIITDLLEYFTESEIEKDYIPIVLSTVNVDSREILQKFAEMLGKIVYSLKPFELHIRYKEKFIEFF